MRQGIVLETTGDQMRKTCNVLRQYDIQDGALKIEQFGSPFFAEEVA